MRVTILDGDMEKPSGKQLSVFLKKIIGNLNKNGHEVSHFHLKDMNIKHCIGCWGCWVKTPGKCVLKDAMPLIYKDYVNADLLIFASPIKMSFISSLIKRTIERLIPVLHPYASLVEGEFHHSKRYENYPDIGVILEIKKDNTEEEIALIHDYFDRLGLNFFGEVKFLKTTNHSVKEVADEINSI